MPSRRSSTKPIAPAGPRARDSAHREIPIRITVLRPPRGVSIQVQRGREDLLPPEHVTDDSLSFDFLLRVEMPPAGGQPNFLGEFAQGPRDRRFVYVNSGSGAGQQGSCWNRRAKVPLGSITSAQISAVLSRPGQVLEAQIEGTARDGGPMCATVPLLGGGWKVKRATAR